MKIQPSAKHPLDMLVLSTEFGDVARSLWVGNPLPSNFSDPEMISAHGEGSTWLFKGPTGYFVVNDIPRSDDGLILHLVSEKAQEYIAPLRGTISNAHRLLILTDYVDGDVIGAAEIQTRLQELREIVARMQTALTTRSYPSTLPSIADHVRKLASYSNHNPTKKNLERSLQLLDQSQNNGWIPVHYDLHRSNIIKKADQYQFIDLDSFLLAPPEFQEASFRVAFEWFNSPADRPGKYFEEGDNHTAELFFLRAIIGQNHFINLLAQGNKTQFVADAAIRYRTICDTIIETKLLASQ